MNSIFINKFWLIVMLFLISLGVSGQTGINTISGKVTDAEQIGLPGVTVVIAGTTVGTTTDMDGNYSLDIPEEIDNPELLFSYIGFAPVRIVTGAQTTINVVLQEDITMLDEFVVVGYGIQRKVDVSGAISTVGSEELSNIPVGGIVQALQGKAAGVNITHTTGMPGEGVSVRIRGIGSINSSNSPLYIVDGVPTVDALNNLSPNDIESVSILKDAASAAIYGSRANNGVVLITTKKGVSGEPRIEISTQVGMQQHGPLLPMANRDQYVQVYNEAANNDNAFIENPRFHRQLITDELAASLPDVNHLEEIFRNGIIQNHNISVSGGTEDLTYVVSGNMFQQDGIIIGSGFERASGRLGLNSKVNKNIQIGTNINISQSDNDLIGSSGDGFGGNGGSIVRYALFRTPGIAVRNAEGEYVDLPQNQQLLGDGYNPVALANKMNNNLKENRLFGDFNAQIRILPELHLSSVLGMDRTDLSNRRFNENWGTGNRINNPNSLNISNGYNQSFSASNVLSYNTQFANNHSLSAVFGTEAIRSDGYVNNSTQRDFPDQEDRLVFLGNGLGSVVVNEGRWASTLLSLFGRLNYTYMNKYILSGTIRRDGSSRFSPENRWGTFYSISGAWRIDQEGFMEGNEFFDMLKLRAGFGAIGNQEVGNYAYSDQIAPNFNYPFGGTMNSGYAITLLGNQNLQWETSTQLDIGLDVSVLQGRIYFEADVYRKITANMLVKEPIPPSAGYASPAWVNNGEILNQGVELELTWLDEFGDLEFELSGNASFVENEILSLSGPIVSGRIDNGIYATRNEVGHPVGSFFLYEMDGIFQNDLDIITSAYQGVNVRPGDVRYVDQNSDGFINELDRKHLGSASPDFLLGFNLALNYRMFDFSMFWQGAFGQQIYYQVATDIEGFYRPFNITQRFYDERWTGEGTGNTQPRASWSSKANNTRPSTRFLEDGSYLRLKNIQLGYTLPSSLTDRFGMQKLRVYVLAHNIFTFTQYPGLDPEMTVSDNSRGEGDAAAGIDWGTYPLARSFNFGVQVSF
jgi:TonB-dependent starch-binding outer membrane protein SusC